MPSASGLLEIDPELNKEPKTFYLTLVHLPCKTKRTFKMRETFKLFISGETDGFYALSKCPKCNTAVMVQIIRAKDLDKGWSYGIPLQEEILTVQDNSELMED